MRDPVNGIMVILTQAIPKNDGLPPNITLNLYKPKNKTNRINV